MSSDSSSVDPSIARRFTEYVGVYDADATLWGEVSYWIGARFGARHCSLCDVTHGLFRQRAEWKACALELTAPFVTYHRNDAPEDVRAAAAGNYPIVLGRHAGSLVVLLTNADIERYDGSPQALAAALLAKP
ncbi:MAG: hypothetical protein EBW96_05275 [Actinobacteria bacterium]|nr:hypothetical protein [Actinomycetota bacterium]